MCAFCFVGRSNKLRVVEPDQDILFLAVYEVLLKVIRNEFILSVGGSIALPWHTRNHVVHPPDNAGLINVATTGKEKCNEGIRGPIDASSWKAVVPTNKDYSGITRCFPFQFSNFKVSVPLGKRRIGLFHKGFEQACFFCSSLLCKYYFFLPSP